MISIIDYGLGNIHSITNALNYLGYKYVITNDPEEVIKTRQIIIPGVGAFGAAIDKLRESGIDDAIVEVARLGYQVIGICLGMHLLATRSYEFGNYEGLDLIPGSIVKLPKPSNKSEKKIPNIGWNEVYDLSDSRFLIKLSEQPFFYFMHSYYFMCEDKKDIDGYIDFNGMNIPVIVGRENTIGFQFHPEKSGESGLNLLDLVLSENINRGNL